MTVTKVSIKPRRVELTADGILTDFDFDFKVFKETEVKVYLRDLLDVSVLQTITTDYTVTFDSEAETGTISFLTPPTVDYIVLMIGNAEYEQQTDIPKGGGFSEPVVEKAYDILAIQIQQLKDNLDRAVTLSETSALDSVTLPDPTADWILGWNPAADDLINIDPSLVGAANAAAAAASAVEAAASAAAAAASAVASASSASDAAAEVVLAQAEVALCQAEVVLCQAEVALAALEVGYSAEWANKAYGSLISAAAGGDLVDDYSSLSWAVAATHWATYAEDSLIPVIDGGDGATDYSALHWAAKAAASAASVNLPTPSFPADEGKIMVARAAAAVGAFDLEANLTTAIDDFTIINPTGNIETAPFILNNIILNAMKIAVLEGVGPGGLSDGIIDTYNDQTGIDLGVTADATFETGSYRTIPPALAADTKLLINGDGYNGQKDIADISGQDHIVSVANATPYQVANHSKWGDHAFYNPVGGSGYLNYGDDAAWAFGTADVCFDFWVKLDRVLDTSNYDWFFSKNNVSSTDDIYGFINNLGELRFTTDDSGGAGIDVTTRSYRECIRDNDWHHIAMGREGTDHYIYLDGYQVGLLTNTVQDMTSTGGSLLIGARPSNPLEGYMDEFRIYMGNPFSAAPIPAPYCWYPLNDSAANNVVVDFGSGGNDGTFWANTDLYDKPGKVNKSLQFGSPIQVNIDSVVAGIASDTTGTVIFWINRPSQGGSHDVFGIADSGTSQFFSFGATNDGIRLYVHKDGANYSVWSTATPQSSSANVWEHWAAVCNGSTVLLYKNGVDVTVSSGWFTTLLGTGTAGDWLSALPLIDNGRLGCTAANGVDGNHFNGRAEDVRYYNNTVLSASQVAQIRDAGVAGYYDMGGPQITVPTAAHTPDVNTTLLLHMENTFDDSSATGAVNLSSSASYMTSEFGNACGIFDGTAQSLQIPNSADWDVFGSLVGDQTIGFWAKFAQIAGTQGIINHWQDSSNNWWIGHQDAVGTRCQIVSGGGSVLNLTGGAIADEAWHYITMCKVGADVGLYTDGVQEAFATLGLGYAFTGTLYIGFHGSDYFSGNLDDIHFNAANLFTAAPNVGLTDTITVPTVAAVADANSVLLLNFNVADEGPNYHQMHYTSLTTTTPKWGTASYSFDGSSSFLSFADSRDWDVAADPKEDWTMDLWVKHTDHTGNEEYIVQDIAPGSDRWHFRHRDTVGIQFSVVVASVNIISVVAAGAEITDTNWHHVALIKKGSESPVGADYGVYLDGTQYGYGQSAAVARFPGSNLYIGATGISSDFFDGQMDGIRISQSNTVFAGAPNIGLTDTITIPVAAPSPIAAAGPAMLLQSVDNAVVGGAPDNIVSSFDLEDIDPTVLLNTDVTLEVSRDGGTTFTVATLSATSGASRRIITATTDVSGQPDPGVDLAEIVYKLESANEVQWRVHAATLIWG